MTLAEWKAVVYLHRGLPSSVKVLLLFLADHMADDLTVSVPQSELTERLGLWRQHVSDRVKAAVAAGVLTLVEPAHGRRPAVYVASRRGTDSVTSTGSARGTDSVTSTTRRGTVLGASTKPTPESRGTDSVTSTTRRGTKSVTSTCNEITPCEPSPERPTPQHLKLVATGKLETAPDSPTGGQVDQDSLLPAVSLSVGGPGGGLQRPDAVALCKHLADRIETNGAKRPTITKAWTDEARRLIDIDKRPLDQAHQLIDWCQADSFWSSNILSMRKFRKQYDQLRLKRLHDQRRTPETSNGAFSPETLAKLDAAAATYDRMHGL